ncbi:hypothetical protein CFC21_045612 [Triticum aestivum]|uniref:Uncharacterized protein n=4 Tax=Triticinae TaxID=1648030 RepID=A0A453DV04_AEGTS|nr:hypothetical protein CFC21_045612 [Triticum aestivum]
MRIALALLLTLTVLFLASDVEADCTTSVINRPNKCTNAICEQSCDARRQSVCGDQCRLQKASCVGKLCGCTWCN